MLEIRDCYERFLKTLIRFATYGVQYFFHKTHMVWFKITQHHCVLSSISKQEWDRKSCTRCFLNWEQIRFLGIGWRGLGPIFLDRKILRRSQHFSNWNSLIQVVSSPLDRRFVFRTWTSMKSRRNPSKLYEKSKFLLEERNKKK